MKNLWAAIVSVCLLGAIGCGGSSGTTANPTQARFVHLISGFGNLDVVNEHGNTIGSNVAYGVSTGYVNVPPQSNTFTVRHAGTTTVVATRTQVIPQGANYTLYALGRINDNQFIVLPDAAGTPASGRILIRLVHGCAISGTIDIYVTPATATSISGLTPTHDNVTRGTITPYLDLAAGTHKFWITPSTNQTVLQQSSLTASSQFRGTVVIADNAAGTAPELTLQIDRN